MKFESIALSGSGEKVQNRFSTWLLGRPSRIFDQNDFAIFDVQVTPILSIKFRVNRPFYSGEEVQNSFSRWQLWRPSCISDQNDFLTIFDLQVTSMTLAKFQVNWPFGSGGEAKIFQYGCHGCHLGFPIGTNVAIFDLPVTPYPS